MKITRDDERKLYEAYEVLDRIINKKSTFNIILNEKIDLIMDKIERDMRGFVFHISQASKYYELSNLTDKVIEILRKYREELKNESN